MTLKNIVSQELKEDPKEDPITKKLEEDPITVKSKEDWRALRSYRTLTDFYAA